MGSIVISIDAELGWGFHDYETAPSSRVEAGRPGWRTLLDIFETHDVPATWAVVGHLFLENCDRRHADHPSVEGWFERESASWQQRPELRFCPDLIGELDGSAVDHEIACHSFSHVLFGDDRTTPEIARAELEAAVEAARSFGVEYESFVFPRNDVGYRDLLAEFGFSCYRGAGSESSSRVGRALDKLLAAARGNRADLVTPTVDEYGLVDVPPSLFLFGFEGVARRIAESVWDDPIVRQAKHGIDRACREEGVFHLWLHPNNLVRSADARRVESIVAYAAAKREATDLTVETMADIAARTGRETRRRPLSNVAVD